VEPLKNEVAARVANALGLKPDEVASALEAPKDPKRGDLALPCFKLAKLLGREGKDAPLSIARDIVARAKRGDLLSEISLAGPFVNFRFAPGALAASVLKAIAAPGRYGGSDEGKGKRVVIDYSSPNIAKSFHLGHLRSTVIGHSIRRLYESLGYEVLGVNHLGDWGTQFGFMLAAWQRWQGEAEERIRKGEGEIDVFVSLYVRINQLAKQDPNVRDEARSWFRRLEEGDAEARRLWTYFVDRSKGEFNRIYAILGIKHESEAGEAFYNDKMTPVIEKVRAKGLLLRGKAQKKAEEDEDDLGGPVAADARPWVVELRTPEEIAEQEAAEREADEWREKNPGKPLPKDLAARLIPRGLGVAMLLKSDGGTTYATRDLAAAFYRENTYKPEKIVYVVGAPQMLHFKQLKKILELMGETWQEKIVHVPFGQYLGMSTREGNVVFLDEVLERAKAVAIEAGEAATKKQDLTPDEVRENARKIGAGAVKFFDLKNGRMKDIELAKLPDGKIDLDRILSSKGETGPYVQFSYARLSGVLRRLGDDTLPTVNYSLLNEPETNALLKALGEHPQRVRQALAEFEPSVIARHVLDVAAAAHSFLHVHRVIDAEPDVRSARAILVSCAKKVIGQCLDLLGIEPLEKM
jgi:arginyl-tRNA synthetase